MTKKTKQLIKMPYAFIVLTIIPIFIIAFLLPTNPETNFHLELDTFLNEKLLGLVGFWTSSSAFSSKLITNYISIFGPLFSIITFIKIRKTMIIDPDQYESMTIAKYSAILISITAFIFFAIYAFYMQETDLGTLTQKWGFLGRHIIPYALFSSGILLVFHCFPIIAYSALYFIPQLLLKRQKQKQ